MYWKYIPAILATNTNNIPNTVSKLSIMRLPILCVIGNGVGVRVRVEVGITGVKVGVDVGVGGNSVIVGTAVGGATPISKARRKIGSSALPKKTLNTITCVPVVSGDLIDQDHSVILF